MSLLWIDYLNSEAHDALGHGRDEDRLEKPGWLEAFLQRWSLPAVAAGRPAVRRALRDLRGVIRGCTVRIHAGKPARSADVAAVNRYLRAQPVVAQLQRDRGAFRMDLVPVTSGLDGVLSAIVRGVPLPGRRRAAQALREPRLPVGVLRRDPEPHASLVRRLVREPDEGAALPGAPALVGPAIAGGGPSGASGGFLRGA